ncbi:MAG: DUF1566 domain-containing protein [Desulfobacterales bacterium]|nr:DUF1566 domain-containing protein [Desulfobacterales bacterium]MCP4163108.1 DUF1566 domain-containing protein [Deltaproteobacteria bacterium]
MKIYKQILNIILTACFFLFFSACYDSAIITTKNTFFLIFSVWYDSHTNYIINSKPVADAGADQIIDNSGIQVSLDGNNSYDADGDRYTYSWNIISKPSDSIAALDNSEADCPTFYGDAVGLYEIQLIVNDGKINSIPDTTIVKVGKFVVDTGQTQFYAVNFGEDSDYTINPPSFKKLNSSGAELDDSVSVWSMVKDNVTCLIWENKTNDGSINDYDDEYTWQDAQDVFITDLNSGSGFCGYTDWRLPTVKELSTIINSGRFPSTVNGDYFINTKSLYYWTVTTYAGNTVSAWLVDFFDGEVLYHGKTNSNYVRAVRSGQ